MPVQTVDQLVIDCDVDCIWLYIIFLAQAIVEITTHRIIQNAPNMCKSGKHKKPFLKSFISFFVFTKSKNLKIKKFWNRTAIKSDSGSSWIESYVLWLLELWRPRDRSHSTSAASIRGGAKSTPPKGLKNEKIFSATNQINPKLTQYFVLCICVQ